MIKKTLKGYQVKSSKGKNLSKDNLTKEEADRRLAEVEYFKNKSSKSKKTGKLPPHGEW